ncbi:MAG: gliding motility-associated ABC transporter substrate-binding protein GldG, partial [Flavobacteriales bacterium]|nr:gliding motility-associated ABC transporter substrate-binding protein GldG [Flavobacteriales bacterium]
MKGAQSDKVRVIAELILGVVFFAALTYLSTFFFARFDLTEEKRHTLTSTTIDVVKELDDVVYVKVFLEGDFPADYQRLRQAVKEKLDEMRAYAGDNVQYEFINPSEAPDQESREAMYGELVERGLDYTSLQIKKKDGLEEKIIFPGALLSYKDKEIPLQILRNQQRATDAELVNRTINNLEYAFVNAFYLLKTDRRRKVAIIQGHGELPPIAMRSFQNELLRYYDVEYVELEGLIDILSRSVVGSGKRENRYDAIVVAKPTRSFSEKDKYIIDQFIINGGKALWMIDAMHADLDSLRKTEVTMSTPLRVNLDDMLFNYGVRLNRDLLIDRTCAPISLRTGPKGNERTELLPWYFQPILIPDESHPITANVDPILTDFIGSIDTVAAPGIDKKLILHTSQYTRILKSPVRVSFNIVGIDPDFGSSNRPRQPVAALLEGKFTSNFANRLPPEFYEQSELGFKEEGSFTRQLVIADGDIARNIVSPDSTRFRELGYDPNLRRMMYGNNDFLINAVNYLLGDARLINVRSRSIALR